LEVFGCLDLQAWAEANQTPEDLQQTGKLKKKLKLGKLETHWRNWKKHYVFNVSNLGEVFCADPDPRPQPAHPAHAQSAQMENLF